MKNKAKTFQKALSLIIMGIMLVSFVGRNTVPVHAEMKQQTGCSSWNVTNDFKTHPDQENPNRDSCGNVDVWSFMQSANGTRNPADYTLLLDFTNSGYMGGPVQGLNYWQGTYTDPWGVYPFIGYNATGSAQGTWARDTIRLHPAPGGLTIIGWRSPISGYVSVTGGVVDGHSDCGDGVQWYIDRNSANLAHGDIPNGGSQAFSAGTGGTNLSAVTVNAGDTIYFIVHPKGSISCDSTDIEFEINTTANPPAPTSTPFACNNWNLTDDFLTTPNLENPNRDSCNNLNVWNFLQSASLTHDPAGYTLLPNFTDSGINGGPILGLNYWQGNYTDPWGIYPFIGYNATGAMQGTWPPNSIRLHPAPSQMPVVGWRSPINGYVSITGVLTDTDAGCGDGIQWFVDRNDVNLASGSIPNGGSQSFSSGTGGAGLDVVVVDVDDMLYVIVHPNWSISCDSTEIELSIAVTTPPTATPTPTVTSTATPTFTPTATYTPTVTATSTPTVTPTSANSYTYDRVAAVAYADLWAHDRNPNYPNYGVDADGNDCDDCTNFLSQVLEAGGLSQIPGDDDAFHWFTYQNIWGTWLGSRSWAATDWFNRHAAQYQATRYEYYPDGPSSLSEGDFFLMDLPTNPLEAPDHARIIMGVGVVLEGDYIGEWKLLASQHCIDRHRVVWDYKLPENVLLWAWHVIP